MTHDELERLAELVAARLSEPSAPRLVNAETAAKMLDVPPSWLMSEARKGRVPHVKLGKYRRFDPSALAEWARERASR